MSGVLSGISWYNTIFKPVLIFSLKSSPGNSPVQISGFRMFRDRHCYAFHSCRLNSQSSTISSLPKLTPLISRRYGLCRLLSMIYQHVVIPLLLLSVNAFCTNVMKSSLETKCYPLLHLILDSSFLLICALKKSNIMQNLYLWDLV